jgi:hypothetical protein
VGGVTLPVPVATPHPQIKAPDKTIAINIAAPGLILVPRFCAGQTTLILPQPSEHRGILCVKLAGQCQSG